MDITHPREHQEPIRAWPETVGFVVLAKRPVDDGYTYDPMGAVFLTLEGAQDSLQWHDHFSKTDHYGRVDPVKYVIGEVRERLA